MDSTRSFGLWKIAVFATALFGIVGVSAGVVLAMLGVDIHFTGWH